jgi:hypothetical protein
VAYVRFHPFGLLRVLNRNVLAPPLRVRGARLAMLGWSVALFGVLSAATLIDKGRELFG